MGNAEENVIGILRHCNDSTIAMKVDGAETTGNAVISMNDHTSRAGGTTSRCHDQGWRARKSCGTTDHIQQIKAMLIELNIDGTIGLREVSVDGEGANA